MPKAIVVRQTGGPEVLKLENIAKPKAPNAGQVLLRHTAIGVNFLDIYYRNGVYKAPRYPMIPGMEAVGIVEAVGEGVKIPVGQKVIYATAQTGAYCEYRVINARHLVGVPASVPDNIAVAGFAKAMTAHYLLFRTYQIQRGQTILVHAAAGAVGSMICQWAKFMGAKVIGTVGSAQKINIARENGCDFVINYSEQDFVKEVLQITNGVGVHVVYDSVGKDTFSKSLKCLMNLGLMVSFGQSSGNVPPVNILTLAQKGLYITRPTLMLYKSDPRELMLSAIEVFTMLDKKALRPRIFKTYKLEDVAQAHADIEARRTIGSSVIML